MNGSSLRFDMTTGDWIVFSPQRSARPSELDTRSEPPAAPQETDCAFCPGNEGDTLPQVDVETDPGNPERWLVRAFGNKYPALAIAAPNSGDRRLPLFRQRGGHGVHEVVVCSPAHFASIARLPERQVTALLRVLQRRYQRLSSKPEIEMVQIFANHGARAGASLVHPHVQILAAPVVPRRLRVKYQAAAEYYHAQGASLYQDVIQAELDAKTRIIIDTPDFIAFAPFASRVPYEAWIVPRDAKASFGQVDADCLPALGRTLRELMQRVQVALDDPDYNLTFFSAPRRHADEPDFVWHIEVLPRLAIDTGFELATGMAINSVLPEAAAEALRGAQLT